MKKLEASLLLAMMLLLGGITFVSCSSDDDDNGGDVDSPAYSEYAAKYQIQTGNADYSSVEFTESGNYVITKRYYYSSSALLHKLNQKLSPNSRLAGFIPKANAQTRGSESPILFGTYTIDSNGDYVLAGFGKVRVTKDGSGNSYSLEFIINGGGTVTYTATQLNQNLNSDQSNRLCRTWDISAMQIVAKLNGQTLMDIYADSYEDLYKQAEEWAKKNDEDYDPSDWEYEEEYEPVQVIFTKTGTYMVVYSDQSLAVSTWKWTNSSENTIMYSWDNSFDEDYESGYVTVEFKGSQLIVTEKMEEDEGFELYETYYLNEAK